jgi:O-antigen ligase
MLIPLFKENYINLSLKVFSKQNISKPLVVFYVLLAGGSACIGWASVSMNIPNLITILLGLYFTCLLLYNSKLGTNIIAISAITPLALFVAGVYFHIADAMTLFLCALWLISSAISQKKIKLPSIFIPNLIFLFTIILSLLNTDSTVIIIKEIMQYCVFAFVYPLFFFNNVHTKFQIKTILNILCFGTGALGFISFIGFLITHQSGLYLFGFHKNALGSLLVITIPFLFMRFYFLRDKLWGIALVCTSLGLLCTLSRGAWVGGICGIMLVILLLKQFRLALNFAAIAVICLVMFIMFMPNKVLDDTTSSHTMNIRQLYWSMSISGFQEKPWTGWGYSRFIDIVNKYAVQNDELTGDPHNIIMRFLSEIGIIGTSAFLFFVFFIYFKTIKSVKFLDINTKGMIIGLLGCLTAYFVHGLFDVFWVRGTGALFWIILSLLFVLTEKELAFK